MRSVNFRDVQVLMDGQHACDGIARELRSATPHDIAIPSFSGRMELDKQDDRSLFDTSIQGEVEACQILEDTSFPISEFDTPGNLQVIVEDGPINSALIRGFNRNKTSLCS